LDAEPETTGADPDLEALLDAEPETTGADPDLEALLDAEPDPDLGADLE